MYEITLPDFDHNIIEHLRPHNYSQIKLTRRLEIYILVT